MNEIESLIEPLIKKCKDLNVSISIDILLNNTKKEIVSFHSGDYEDPVFQCFLLPGLCKGNLDVMRRQMELLEKTDEVV